MTARRSARGLRFGAAVLTVLLLLAAGVEASAQSPFGVGRAAPPAAAADGIVGWIIAKQAEFYRGLSAMIRAAKADGSAVWALFGLSFLYGVFHAAGPGHGKAVISSYVVANAETWWRGVLLSFASAMLQALVAVALVTVAAGILGATARIMEDTVRVIEIASYLFIAAIGGGLLWIKGQALAGALTEMRKGPVLAPAGAAVTAGVAPEHAAHRHDRDAPCHHAHMPRPADMAGPGGWKRGLAAVTAVGLRPCSGAVVVLVFALTQGLYWAGVVSTFIMGLGTALTVAAIAVFAVAAKSVAVRFAHRRTRLGSLVLRGVETAAAALVLAFGVLLLMGYIASERLGAF